MELSSADRERFASEFIRVSQLAEEGDEATSVREGGRLLEELCKEVVALYLPRVEIKTRSLLLKKEAEIGQGQKGLGDFTFGQIVGLMRESSFLDAVGEVDARSVTALKGINWSYIIELRNEGVHKGVDFEPEAYDVQLVLSSLRICLLYFGVQVSDADTPREKEDPFKLLQERFSSVEVIEGTQAFFRRILEIAQRPEIDTFDVTFLVENPPKPNRSGRDSATEYFRTVREKVVSGDARLRRIVTFNNPAKSAWILYNLVGGHHEVYDSEMRLAFFDAKKHSGAASVMIPNLTLFYSSQDVSDGYAWIYSTQEDDNQNFVCLSGKAVFSTMRRLYASWFRSCESLTEEKAKQMFTETFGYPETRSDLEQIAQKHASSIGLDERSLEKSINYWARQYELG
jgi:hypothetical protein